MKRFTSILVLAIALSTAACSGNDGEIKLESATGPLTDKGGDATFTIDVVESREEGYAPDAFRVRVTPEGQEILDVSCAFDDVNANKRLDKGDKLTCSEGPENKLDAQIAGKEAKVELFAKIDGSEERIGDATWTPAK